MKKVLILGGGGFIGGHLAKKLKGEGNFVRVVDIKKHEFFAEEEISNEFLIYDLRCPYNVKAITRLETHSGEILPFSYEKQPYSTLDCFDEVYQLAADMGGAEYLFTGEHDADIVHNSAIINLNVAKSCIENGIKKVFYSSSACIYPEYNQMDPDNPNCEEFSAYPADPDSEYGWEKLFSERLFLSFHRNYKLDVRIARFHNIFGPMGTWRGGKEKSPAAMCRKAAEASDGDTIEVWGDGLQTRSFLYIDECIEMITRFMQQEDFIGPVNIGSEEMVSINHLASLAIKTSKKDITIRNIQGEEFKNKYGFVCPVGVRGRNSDNKLFKEKMGWEPTQPLSEGIAKAYTWINKQVQSL